MRYPFIIGVFLVLLGSHNGIAQAEPTSIPVNAPVISGETAAAINGQLPDAVMWPTDNPAQAAATSPSAFASKYRTVHKFTKIARRILSRTSNIAAGLTRSALRFLGTPYVFGGTSPGGFDCSGYVQHVFATIGIRLPRTADAQYYAGIRVHGGVAAGDLVFFQTYERGPSHVGIYLGNGSFVHSSSSRGVMVSRMHDSYWASRYIGAKRVAVR
ncbi:MAG: C40 family peptidase [Candidatus Eremiobacteraeota bacterium]|nr:C40 family peptidase [Candidatus Eremiobacteraeota bacterium]